MKKINSFISVILIGTMLFISGAFLCNPFYDCDDSCCYINKPFDRLPHEPIKN